MPAVGGLDRKPSCRTVLGLRAARLSARPARSAHLECSRRHLPLPCPTAGTDGGDQAGRPSGHARDAQPRPAGSARPSDAADRLCRGAAALGTVGLDHGQDDTIDGSGWVEILEAGVLVTLRGKTDWREIEIARGSSDQTYQVQALKRWLEFAKIEFGAQAW